MNPGDLTDLGLDPSWSRTLESPDAAGVPRRWHLLDRPAVPVAGDGVTVVCLHGNPTWSILWSRLFVELDPRHRVIAPDHLSMGYSENVGARRYRERVTDVLRLLDTLEVTGPVWLLGHDWGGAIAMGVAVARPERFSGLLLANTGIAVPDGRRAPSLIRLAASRGLHRGVTRSTSLFVRGTPLLPGLPLTRAQRRALAAPYCRAESRDGVAGFVADVPFDASHPSSRDIRDVAEALPALHIPVRLVWGARDPVFDDTFADDLLGRFLDARLHRLPDAGHLSVLETSIAPILEAAIADAPPLALPPALPPAPSPAPSSPGTSMVSEDPAPMWSRIVERADSHALAVSDARTGERIDAAAFALKVGGYVVSLKRLGIARGERVAVLVPPSVEMLAALYALWRIGAVAVVADKGLGLRGLGRALRSARPAVVLGERKALLAARTLRWAPGARGIRIEELEGPGVRPEHLTSTPPGLDDDAAVVFTSGATGPAKGVRYTHRQLCAQRDALRALYAITEHDSLVAAFAPFAVFGPALGIGTGLVDMDVSRPSTLTAAALEDACARSSATLVFASPSALTNVVRTVDGPLPAFSSVRLVLSAGAPVPVRMLEAVAGLCPSAEIRTPYGMTEILPVSDVSLPERITARPASPTSAGVCVGRPVPGCRVRIEGLDGGAGTLTAGTTGEVVVRAAWMSSGYDRLWYTEHRARPVVAGEVWHRTGDVGHLDADGNLWIEGRLVHLLHTEHGPLTPVPIEVAAESVAGVARAAAVGVGPKGLQQVVVVVELVGRPGAQERVNAPASEEITRAIRAASPVRVAAVWVSGRLPVDIRHNAKIDRTALAVAMGRLLRGGPR